MAASVSTRKFLFYFANEHVDFRLAELSSIISVFNYDIKLPECDVRNPFLVLDLPSEDQAKKIVSRAILVKSVYELWVHCKTQQELSNGLKRLPEAFLAPHVRSKETFKYEVISFNKTLVMKDRVSKIENLPLDFEGKVDLKNAARVYSIFEYYGPFGSPSTEEPVDIYFGKWLADGQRDDIRKYDLKKRYFIANTSMDAGLSMIMANMGKVNRNTVVLDPFVGSGSLLVAAAHFGAYVLGTDLNYLLLHAKAKPSRVGVKKRQADESIRANLRQYGLEDQYLDVMVADASRGKVWREQTLFHAIITDPPYGVREKTKKVGTEEKNVYIDEELIETGRHISRKLDYNMAEMFKDLLNFSAKYLHKNGRLVYWFPVNIKSYTEANIPTHPCLKLVHNCEQPLNSQISRRLVTMEKVADFCESLPGAAIRVDHYEESSFRDMFFNEETLQKERIPGTGKKQRQKVNSKKRKQTGPKSHSDMDCHGLENAGGENLTVDRLNQEKEDSPNYQKADGVSQNNEDGKSPQTVDSVNENNRNCLKYLTVDSVNENSGNGLNPPTVDSVNQNSENGLKQIKGNSSNIGDGRNEDS